MKLEYPLFGMVIRKCLLLFSFNFVWPIKILFYVGYAAILALVAMKIQTLLMDLPRIKVGVPYTDFINQYIISTWKWCSYKQASFCQASSGRLAVLLQAV